MVVCEHWINDLDWTVIKDLPYTSSSSFIGFLVGFFLLSISSLLETKKAMDLSVVLFYFCFILLIIQGRYMPKVTRG